MVVDPSTSPFFTLTTKLSIFEPANTADFARRVEGVATAVVTEIVGDPLGTYVDRSSPPNFVRRIISNSLVTP